MKKGKVRKYIIIAAITIVLGILSFMMYQSYGYFKVNYTGNIINTNVGEFGVYEYSYTGNAQEFTVPVTGYYNIELWGAMGNTFGYGGYTIGLIELQKDEKIYLYIGGYGSYQNQDNACFGGWNGGGAPTLSSYGNCGLGGGGATDVRLINGTWNDSASLRSRIMVAGGGGGGWTTLPTASAGLGGDLIARTGYMIDYLPQQGQGGTQISGGAKPIDYSNGLGQTSSGAAGAFGVGGAGGANVDNGTGGGGGGGAGYYGGSGSSGLEIGLWNGGGGSSYISGYAGVNSVQQTGGTAAQPLHTNNTIHYSGKYFLNGSMEAGVNQGNGKAKIMYFGSVAPLRANTKLDKVRYIKSCTSGNSSNNGKHWVEIQAIKAGINLAKGKTVIGTVLENTIYPYNRITDGDITTSNFAETANSTTVEYSCVTIDLESEHNLDEITLWSYYSSGVGAIYHDNVLSVGAVNTTGTTALSMMLHNYPGATGYNGTVQGKRYTAWD